MQWRLLDKNSKCVMFLLNKGRYSSLISKYSVIGIGGRELTMYYLSKDNLRS